jgi:apolipoprotein D and lipocalin family protein
MGDWYVLAFIPIDLPFFSEAGAHGAVESYQLDDEGGIDITYTFRDGSFEAEPTVMTQRGRVIDDGRGTEWRVQVFWPFESAYLIAWLDADYERAVVGVPSRSNVWILSRDPLVEEAEFAALRSRVADLGYDPTMLRRVPQRAQSR